jgi:hypothetical protein
MPNQWSNGVMARIVDRIDWAVEPASVSHVRWTNSRNRKASADQYASARQSTVDGPRMFNHDRRFVARNIYMFHTSCLPKGWPSRIRKASAPGRNRTAELVTKEMLSRADHQRWRRAIRAFPEDPAS